MAGVKIGNVAEGAFVIALGLIICDNDLQTQPELKPTRTNIKNLMKKIDPELFVNGGVWNNNGSPIYNGKATLKSKVSGQIYDKVTKQYVNTSQIPPDTLRVNLTIQLNRGEVEPFYGPNTIVNHKDWPTMDGIIDQMLKEGNRYRSVIERVKTKYLTNLREESIIRANFSCELCGRDNTFMAKDSKWYFEVHHLIPFNISNQKMFKFSLDHLSNLVCLCPECHRKVHFAELKEQVRSLETLLKLRKEIFNNYAIKNLEHLLQLYRSEE
jgi:5-methylcytosine-specific restriction endonuclease McrA